jgi:hypothetical protein
MIVSRVRKDGVFDGFVEFPDNTDSLPVGYSFSLPPEIPQSHHAVLMGEWKLIQGQIPDQHISEISIEEVVHLVQKRLDDFASTRGYSGITSACTYFSSTIEQYRVEGTYCLGVRDTTWDTFYKILSEVDLGVRPFPQKFSDIESELPALQWPN